MTGQRREKGMHMRRAITHDVPRELPGEEELLVAIWHQVLRDVRQGSPDVRQEARQFLSSPQQIAFWAHMFGIEVCLLERQAQEYLGYGIHGSV
jgi:hypothetical protein